MSAYCGKYKGTTRLPPPPLSLCISSRSYRLPAPRSR
jgi:hypothetical protein